MMMMSMGIAVLGLWAIAGLVSAVGPEPAGNLIVNWSFEEGRSTPPYNTTGPLNIPGWTIKASIIPGGPFAGYPGSGIYQDCVPHSGNFAVDFGSEVYPDNLTTTVTTTAGYKYRLTFWLWSQLDPIHVQHDTTWSDDGANAAPSESNPGDPIFITLAPGTPGPKTQPVATNNYFNVLINGKSISYIPPKTKVYEIPFAVAPYDASFIPAGTTFKQLSFPSIPFNNYPSFPWVSYTYVFTAATTTTTLTFQGTNAGSHFSFDDVSVVLVSST